MKHQRTQRILEKTHQPRQEAKNDEDRNRKRKQKNNSQALLISKDHANKETPLEQSPACLFPHNIETLQPNITIDVKTRRRGGAQRHFHILNSHAMLDINLTNEKMRALEVRMFQLRSIQQQEAFFQRIVQLDCELLETRYVCGACDFWDYRGVFSDAGFADYLASK